MEYKTEGFLYSIIFFSYRIRIIKLYIYNVAIKLKKYKQKKNIYILFLLTLILISSMNILLHVLEIFVVKKKYN